jgi:hypothetical protein
MIVVSQEAKGMDAQIEFFNSLGKISNHVPSINSVAKNVFALINGICTMIQSTGVFDP